MNVRPFAAVTLAVAAASCIGAPRQAPTIPPTGSSRYAGPARAGGGLVTAGGRVLGVQTLGDDVAAAIRTAYAAVERIRFDGAHYRRDIGHHALRRLG